MLLISCKKDSNYIAYDEEKMGYNYYPIKINSSIVYDVEEISYNDYYIPVKIDTNRYLLKEYIESDYIDNTGSVAYRLERYLSKKDTIKWQIKDVWTINKTYNSVERVEENLRIIKMIFPITPQSIWNGNLYNNNDYIEYKYSNIGESFLIDSILYNNTVKVIHESDSSLIHKNYEYEVYAMGIGMIYKKSIHIKTLVNGMITSGSDITYKRIVYE